MGDAYFQNLESGKDVILRANSGSGAEEYLKLDGGLSKTVFSKPSVWLDNQTVQFGNAADLQIKHNGTDSRIDNSTGDLLLVNYANSKDIGLYSDDGSGGVTSYLTIDGSATDIKVAKAMRFNDLVSATFGDGADLRIAHDGTDSYVNNFTGNLNLVCYADAKDILLQSDDGSGGVATYLTIDGSREEVVVNKPLVQTPASSSDDPTNNGELIFTVASNTSIKVKYKGTDGVVRSTSLTLS